MTNLTQKYLVLFLTLTTVGVIFYLYLFSYTLSFIQFEKSLYSKLLLAFGYRLSLNDIYFVFDFISLDGAPRARFISNLFLIFDVKFRMYLLQYLPLHSSFSFSWVLVATAVPILFFSFVKRITGSNLHSSIGTILYVSSAGFLGPLNMSFHPAKPLGNLFLILFILLLTYLPSTFTVLGKVNKKHSKFLIWISILTLIMLFTDETMLIILAIPLIFLSKDWMTLNYFEKNSRIFLVNIILPFTIYLLLIVFLLPRIIEISVLNTTGLFVEYDYFSWAFLSNDNVMDTEQLFESLKSNLKNMLWFHSLPFSSYNNYFINVESYFLYGFFIFGILNNLQSKRYLFLRFAACTILLIFLQTLLMSRHSVQTIEDPFYYGCAISIFAALSLSFLVMSFLPKSCAFQQGPTVRWQLLLKSFFGIAAFLYLVHINLNNYLISNEAWRGAPETKLTREYVSEIWAEKNDANKLWNKLQLSDKRQELHFLQDLYHSNHRNKVENCFGLFPTSPYLKDVSDSPLHNGKKCE